jgi:secreted Zn-dependent insulinase-like peptidase
MVADLVCDSLDELTYSASLAGLGYFLDYHSEGLSVCVYGYRDKLPIILQVVLENIKNLQPRADRLEVFEEKVQASAPAKHPELTTENYRQSVITVTSPCKSQWTMRDITPGTLSMLYNGHPRRSCPRSWVRPANRRRVGTF